MLTIMSNKGQVVIPARLRRRLKLKKGTKLYIEDKGDRIILRPLTDEYLNKLAGLLETGGKLVKSLKTQRELDKKSE